MTNGASLSLELALNGGFHHAQECLVVHHEAHYRTVNFGDFADDARLGHHIHALLQAVHKFLLVFLPLHLRADQKKVEHEDDQEGEQHPEEGIATARSGLKKKMKHHN